MKYTFAIQWPLPFKQDWQTSGQRFDTAREAATAMSDFLCISLDNGCTIIAKLIEVKE